MANVRAIMQDFRLAPDTSSTFVWHINWFCMPLDRAGESFALSTETIVGTGDTAAAVTAKIIDSAVAKAAERLPGYDLPRANVYLVNFVRGS